MTDDTKRTLGGLATHNASGFKFRFEVLVWLKEGTVIRVGPDMVFVNAQDYAKGESYWLQLPVESYAMPRKMRQHLKPNPVGLKSVPVEQATEMLADRINQHAEETAPQHAAITELMTEASLRHVPTPSAREQLAKIRENQKQRELVRRGLAVHTADLVPGPSEHLGLQHNASQEPEGGYDQQFVDDPDRPGTSVLIRRQPGDPRTHTQILLDMRAAQPPEERPDLVGHIAGVLANESGKPLFAQDAEDMPKAWRDVAQGHLANEAEQFREGARKLLAQATAKPPEPPKLRGERQTGDGPRGDVGDTLTEAADKAELWALSVKDRE